jgi:hypothetical protein
VQTTLPLAIPAARPLVPLEACMVLLDRDEDELLAGIEEGALEWAWDIRGPEAERREIRVWRQSVLDFASGTRVTRQHEDVLREILPGAHPRRTPEIQRLFSASQCHVQHLVEAGLLAAGGPRTAASGPASFTLISRESLCRFLAERCLHPATLTPRV